MNYPISIVIFSGLGILFSAAVVGLSFAYVAESFKDSTFNRMWRYRKALMDIRETCFCTREKDCPHCIATNVLK